MYKKIADVLKKYSSLQKVAPPEAEAGYGFIETSPKPQDWVLGGSSQARKIIVSPERDYRKYLPVFESQVRNGVDVFGCVVFSGLNNIEIYMKKVYGVDINFADMYPAGLIPVKPFYGTTFDKFWDAVRKYGLVLEEEYPWNGQDAYEYVKKPPENIIEKGKLFLDSYDIEHEWIDWAGCDPEKLHEALLYGPLQVSVNASATYTGRRDTNTNHAVTIVHSEYGKRFWIFDHYRELYSVPWNFYFGSAKQASVHLKKKVSLVMVWGKPEIYAIYGTTACHIANEATWRYGERLGIWGGNGGIVSYTKQTFDKKFTIGQSINFS